MARKKQKDVSIKRHRGEKKIYSRSQAYENNEQDKKDIGSRRFEGMETKIYQEGKQLKDVMLKFDYIQNSIIVARYSVHTN